MSDILVQIKHKNKSCREEASQKRERQRASLIFRHRSSSIRESQGNQSFSLLRWWRQQVNVEGTASYRRNVPLFLLSGVASGPVSRRAVLLFYHLCSQLKSQLPWLIWLLWQWWVCSAAVEWRLTVNHNFSPISLLIWALIWGGHISCLFSLACITHTFTL